VTIPGNDPKHFETGLPDVTLSWNTFTDAADEAGISRRYGGIHFTDGDLDGRVLGREVATQAWAKVQAFIDPTSIPESSANWGLFGLGVLGIGSWLMAHGSSNSEVKILVVIKGSNLRRDSS
jgi:hypothetical protein